MHVGESVSLSDEEQRKKLLVFAIDRVNGKVPVIAHVSDSGTSIAGARARMRSRRARPRSSSRRLITGRRLPTCCSSISSRSAPP